MKAVNNKILVKVDMEQKGSIKIGGKLLSTANKYETNYRYKAPTIAEVVYGNDTVRKGDVLLCHHNLFYEPSPHQVGEGLFSIPFNKTLFAKIFVDGEIYPICGNILVEEIEVESLLPLPAETITFHKNRYRVINSGALGQYKVGDIIFTRPSAGYRIIYHVDGEQKSVVKVDSQMICGILK